MVPENGASPQGLLVPPKQLDSAIWPEEGSTSRGRSYVRGSDRVMEPQRPPIQTQSGSAIRGGRGSQVHYSRNNRDKAPQTRGPRDDACYVCGRTDHIARNCSRRAQVNQVSISEAGKFRETLTSYQTVSHLPEGNEKILKIHKGL